MYLLRSMTSVSCTYTYGVCIKYVFRTGAYTHYYYRPSCWAENISRAVSSTILKCKFD